MRHAELFIWELEQILLNLEKKERSCIEKEHCLLDRDEVEDLIYIVKEHILLKEKVTAAKEVYQQTDGQNKYADACKELGLNTGKRESCINSKALFEDYMALITRGYCDFADLAHNGRIKPISREKALHRVAEKYDFPSYKAAYQYLKRFLRGKPNLRGLLPPDWPKA